MLYSFSLTTWPGRNFGILTALPSSDVTLFFQGGKLFRRPFECPIPTLVLVIKRRIPNSSKPTDLEAVFQFDYTDCRPLAHLPELDIFKMLGKLRIFGQNRFPVHLNQPFLT